MLDAVLAGPSQQQVVDGLERALVVVPLVAVADAEQTGGQGAPVAGPVAQDSGDADAGGRDEHQRSVAQDGVPGRGPVLRTAAVAVPAAHRGGVHGPVEEVEGLRRGVLLQRPVVCALVAPELPALAARYLPVEGFRGGRDVDHEVDAERRGQRGRGRQAFQLPALGADDHEVRVRPEAGGEVPQAGPAAGAVGRSCARPGALVLQELQDVRLALGQPQVGDARARLRPGHGDGNPARDLVVQAPQGAPARAGAVVPGVGQAGADGRGTGRGRRRPPGPAGREREGGGTGRWGRGGDGRHR